MKHSVTELPFNRFLGLVPATDPAHLLRLPSGPQYLNHLGTVHASAQLALAEASSGEFIFHDIEVLDLGGPFEVFSVATRVKARLDPDSPPPFNVFTIGETTAPIHARGNLIITPSFSFTDHPRIDLLIIPGGIVSAELKKENVIHWIATTSAKARLTASVCTGSFLLAQAGLLDHKLATTHWADIEEMRSLFPKVTVEENVRWIDQGPLITSAGISAGIDMSLHLVSRLESEPLALATAKQMDYRWITS